MILQKQISKLISACVRIRKNVRMAVFPSSVIREIYLTHFNKEIDLKSPKDINEKINWLKLHSDMRAWSKIADKLGVREYAKTILGVDIFPQIYRTYTSTQQIEESELPNSFVIKTNHGSGNTIIIKNKAEIDFEKVKKKIEESIKSKFGVELYEPHYFYIKPRIIVEELLDHTKQDTESCSLIDYKVICLNGRPHSIEVILNRREQQLEIEMYDTNWEIMENCIKENPVNQRAKKRIPKPKMLREMLEIATKLSCGIPLARIDFYIVNCKLYLGEITLTPAGGFIHYFTEEFMLELGNRLVLPDLKPSKP